jgi:hypothetical protein
LSIRSELPPRAPQESLAGRRGEARFTFTATQRVAPCSGDQIPTLDEFIGVRCFDLSRKGFSYLLPQPPTYEMIVAELTLPKQRVYIKARVAHITGMTVEGKFVFQVGCEFTDRVACPPAAAARPEPPPATPDS